MAEELLKSNPGLAAKHSVRSLAAVVDASKKPQDAVTDEIANLPPLKIVRPTGHARRMHRVTFISFSHAG
jgi:hypothetical protein